MNRTKHRQESMFRSIHYFSLPLSPLFDCSTKRVSRFLVFFLFCLVMKSLGGSALQIQSQRFISVDKHQSNSCPFNLLASSLAHCTCSLFSVVFQRAHNLFLMIPLCNSVFSEL